MRNDYILKTYSELIQLSTFEERFNYLQIGGRIGLETFGFDRYLNQLLYKSPDWKRVRNEVLIRDDSCDLGLNFLPLNKCMIHHMNPITKEQVINRDPIIFNPEYLITVSLKTHNAIHYGEKDYSPYNLVTRKPNDTIPWR